MKVQVRRGKNTHMTLERVRALRQEDAAHLATRSRRGRGWLFYLAEKYETTWGNVRNILDGRVWKDVL